MENPGDDLKAIREMMEKSSKFLSLSGLSGIMAGVTAIAGAAFAYHYLLTSVDADKAQKITVLLIDAILVLISSLAFAIYFSWEKAKKNKLNFYNKVLIKTLYNLSIPLAAGGILCTAMLFRGQTDFIAATTLIFYGLALVNASKYTFEEIHYLGITEIILGLCAAIFISNGLIIWTIGFGFCHVIYGFIMYKKYDKI
ncbi:MAG: hypothetical protein H6Q19_1843 [Bacteroidetes bacterium]|nr:hypothetical protein [Bacteroidota bacterium]